MPLDISLHDLINVPLCLQVPVLFPDTCSLLDLVRLAGTPRTDLGLVGHVLSTVGRILTRVREDKCRLVAPVIVRKEVNHRLAEECGAASRFVDEVSAKARHLLELQASLFSIAPMTGTRGGAVAIDPGLDSCAVVTGLRTLIDQLLDATLWLETDSQCSDRAIAWYHSGRKPAGPGGAEFNDCLVLATLLCVSEGLRSRGASLPHVLLSSNYEDFYDSRRRGAHPDLEPSLKSAGIQLCRNLPHAAAVLGL